MRFRKHLEYPGDHGTFKFIFSRYISNNIKKFNRTFPGNLSLIVPENTMVRVFPNPGPKNGFKGNSGRL